MEVRASEWRQKAIDNITQYVNRGGEGQGDVPQLIGGCDLLNTIGWAMGLPTSDPERWTARELERALEGRLVFYEGKAREAIDVVANQIRACCGGDDRNYVTVLPLELYFGGKMYELPLFRVKRTAKSKNFYIDNVGRSYDSLGDWDGNNKFPPGKVAYPTGLRLASSGGRARVSFADTPSARPGSQMAQGADAASAVVGLGASVALLFVSGGLAAPLSIVAAGSAVWGTGRAGYQLADRASHGESVNPFSDSQSRMLWLGVAANLASFGAMGATMRLTSLAARGRDISTAMRILTNVANGTNVAVSGLAILNSTIYMIEHHQDMSGIDVLMQAASIAFWTKGVFTYRTSSMIIRDAQNYAFVTITRDMNPEEVTQLEAVRSRMANDAQLLQGFRAAMSSDISPRDYSRLLSDYIRYTDTVATLSPEQISAFDGLRGFLRDDVRLISGLRRVESGFQLSPRETVERVLHMWQQLGAAPGGDGRGVALRGGYLVLGGAPPVRIDQLAQLSPPMIRFLGEHLSRLDAAAGGHWATAVPVMLELQAHGLFTTCPVARTVSGGRAVLSLNGHLDVSIYRLRAMGADDRARLLRLLARLPAGVGSATLPSELVRLCVREQRLRLECQRREAVAAARTRARGRPALLRLLDGELRSHERDRLYTWASELDMYKADMYVTDMMAFVADMQPATISEMVAYSEFVMTYVEDQALLLKGQIRNGELPQPDVRISVWTRETAAASAFRDTRPMQQRFAELAALVRDNAMVGRATVAAGLADAALVAALRDTRVAFGSVASAAYHAAKHPTQPPSAYVERANATLRNPAASVTVALGQDGDVRTLTVEDAAGRCFVLERDGSVILCSFVPR